MSAPTAPEIEQWLQECLKLAKTAASEDEVPVGAIVIKEGVIIGRGYNRREQDHNPVSHAEITAIQEAAQHLKSWRLTDCTLIVSLEPCPMCLAACQQSRVDAVYYGAKDLKGGALSLGYLLHDNPKMNHRFKVLFQEQADCGRILTDFFRAKRSLPPKSS